MAPSRIRNLALGILAMLVAIGGPALADTDHKTYRAFSKYAVVERFPNLKKRIEAIVLQSRNSQAPILNSRFLFKDGEISYEWTSMTDLNVTLRKQMSLAEATRLAGLLSWHQGRRPVGKLTNEDGALAFNFPTRSDDSGDKVLIERKGNKATSVTYSFWGP